MNAATVILFFVLSSLQHEAIVNAQPQEGQQDHHVTVLGLGVMGKAVVQCYARHGYHVHAWNRGRDKRRSVQDLNLDNVTVYYNLTSAVHKSELILMNIDGDAKLANAESVITSIPEGGWSGRTLVQFSGHLPTAIKEQEKLISSLGGRLIGGAMVADPSILCSDGAILLVSAGSADADDGEALVSQGSLDGIVPVVEVLGKVVAYKGDVGLASLANIGLVQSITFGLAGHEMAHLLMQRYGVTTDFEDQYVALVKDIVPSYAPILLSVISKSIMSKQWQESYVPSADLLKLLEMHAKFIEEMGVASDTYLEGYIRYLRKVSNARFGPSAWIDEAIAAGNNEL